MTNIKPLTHYDKRFAHGYDIRCLRDKNDDYHVFVYGDDRENGNVYKLAHDLQHSPTKSELSASDFFKIYDEDDSDKNDWKLVFDEERNSVLTAFDSMAFGYEDPIYRDEVYNHLADLSDFWDFCEECKRRRKPAEGIGIGTSDVAWCGRKMNRCNSCDRQMCMTLWAVRNAGCIRRTVKPEFYETKEVNDENAK